MPDAWSMTGQYFEACNCEVACPCVFMSDPTHGDCTVLLAYHVDKGKSGTHSLDGLNFAIAVSCHGNMVKNKWEAAIYFDARATDAQKQALQTIVGGQAGGVFAVLGPFIGKVHGIRSVPMEFHIEGKKRSLRIGDFGEMRAQPLTGGDGKEVHIQNAPFGVSPNVSVAKSEILRLKDYGWKWDVEGKNSFFAPFNANGP